MYALHEHSEGLDENSDSEKTPNTNIGRAATSNYFGPDDEGTNGSDEFDQARVNHHAAVNFNVDGLKVGLPNSPPVFKKKKKSKKISKKVLIFFQNKNSKKNSKNILS
jgi:hypothetical protein